VCVCVKGCGMASLPFPHLVLGD